MNPGELYWAELASGRRPVIVVSRSQFNLGTYVTIVPLTTSRLSERSSLPNCILLPKGRFGISKTCVAQADQIAVIDSARLRPPAIGKLDFDSHRSLINAIGYVLNANCELAY